MDKTYRLTRHQLYDLAWSRPLSALAAEFGISGNGLAKICDRLLIPHPPRGYWSSGLRSRTQERPPLPPPPADCDTDVVISGRRAPSRRSRTRLSLTARRDQIVQAASRLIMAEGINAASMKRVARESGISEALAYTYFPSQTHLLSFIARLEQEDLSRLQQTAIDAHTGYLDRVRASQAAYLDYVALKGGLLQTLLGSAEVRKALRMEHQSRKAWSSAATAVNMSNSVGVPDHLSQPGTQVLRAVGVRAGKLLANRKVDRRLAGRLSQAIMDGAREGLIALARRDQAAVAPSALPARQGASRGTSHARGGGQGA